MTRIRQVGRRGRKVPRSLRTGLKWLNMFLIIGFSTGPGSKTLARRNGVGNCRNVNISVPEIKGAPSAEQEAAPPPPLPAPAVPPPGPVVAKAVVVQPTPPAPSM